jgi:pimeloyl-ACP methyl ester carboxylesterase
VRPKTWQPVGCLLLGATASVAAAPASAQDRPMMPIEAPRPEGCITTTAAGDHTFACGDITYRVMVDDMCTRLACGLIFDVHGAGMSSRGMRNNTDLHNLAPRHGYLVVHPGAAPDGPGTWSFTDSPPQMAEFMTQMIDVFHVDRRRVHMTGFSMGAAMTFAFLCTHPDWLASVAVATGSSADQVRAPDGERSCIESLDADWRPRVPIFFMSGIHDPALTAAAAQARTDGLVSRLGLTGGLEVAGDGHYQRRRWTGPDGMILDFLTHDYDAQLERLGGHCMPGGVETEATTCTHGEIAIDWGELVLNWFINHPKGET